MGDLVLLHVSDLHVGRIHRIHGNADWDARAPFWWSLAPQLDGYLGHEYKALHALDELYESLDETAREAGDQLRVIATGDLTCTGDNVEMHSAVELFEHKLTFGKPALGLKLGRRWTRNSAIPGNHDHWPAQMGHRLLQMFGPSNPVVLNQFGILPRALTPLWFGSYQLQLYAIDTDADVKTMKYRLHAIGDFVSQCSALLNMVQPKHKGERRGLLLHHSHVHRARRGRDLEIDDASRVALAHLIDVAEIDILFSGHVHEPTKALHPRRVGQCVELRCGTTTQLSGYKSRTMAEIRKLQAYLWPMSGLPKNTALVHRFRDDGSRPVLQTEVYERRDTGFEQIHVWAVPL